MSPCSICGVPFHFYRPCDQAHEDQCHDCAVLNLSGNFDNREPPAPRDTPRLTTREQQAVAAYTAMLVRTVGAAPLCQLLRDAEETP